MDERRAARSRNEVGRNAANLAVAVILSIAAMAHPAGAAAQDGFGRPLEGTWERLPAPPNPVGLEVADAVARSDGDIVILNTIRRGTNSGACVSVFEPQSETWTDQPIVGDAVEDGSCFLADEQFVVAPDDLIYSTRTVLDPTREPWGVDPGRLGDLDSDTELPLAIAGDLVYVMQVSGSGSGGGPVTRLVEIDVAADAAHATAPLAKINWWLVAGPADSVYAVGLSGTIARYDPADDAWYNEAPAPPADLDRTSAAFGPDGRIYMLGDEVSPSPELWAWDSVIREWLAVAIPGGLSGEFWKPQFVAGHDGALYAMDVAQPYRFIPGEVAEPSAPEPVPTGGPTLTQSPISEPTETSAPSTTPTPTSTPTSSESPIGTASTRPTQSPTASVDADPASARIATGGFGLLVLLLLVVAFLGVMGVMGWRWWRDRRPGGDPVA